MKLATVLRDRPTTVVQEPDGSWQAVVESIPEIVAGATPTRTGAIAVSDEDLVLPYRPGTIIGIGLNFADTVADMGWETPTSPYLFPKLSSSASDPLGPIVIDTDLTTRADYEAELGVVIGRTCKDVSVDDALGHVFGYVAANDVSARDLQAADGQWVRGKGLDTFCPLGPYVVTADEVPDPQDVPIRTWHNGVLVQDGSTASMIFGVAELIAYCAAHFTLHPGDVILTGTPAGCGDFRDPKIALLPGDVVEIEVGTLGRQRNAVVAPATVTS